MVNKNNIILLIVILSIFSTILNDKFLWYYQGDEYLFVTFVKHSLDSDFLKNDWHINTEFNHLNIRLFYTLLISPFYYYLGEEISSPLIYFFTTLILFLGIFKISMKLFDNVNGAILSILIVLISERLQTFVYGIMSNSAVPFFLSISLAVYSISLFIDKKFKSSFFLLGLSALIHLITGIHIFVMLIIYLFLNNLKENNFRNTIITILKYTLIFILIGGINIFGSLYESILLYSNMSAEDYVDFARIFYPNSGYPLFWGLYVYLPFIALVLLFLISFKRCNNWNFVKYLLIMTTFLILLNVFFIVVIPSKFMIKLHFLRLSSILYLLLIMFIGNYIYNIFYKPRLILDKVIILVLLLLIFLTSVRFFFIYILYFLIVILYIRYFLIKRKILVDFNKNMCKKYYFAFIFSFIIIIFILYFFKYIYLHNILFYFSILAIFLIILNFNGKTFNILFLSLFMMTFLFAQKIYSDNYYEIIKTKYDAFNYIKENTPKDSIFLIPPNYYDFRLIAQRAVVVDIFGLMYYDLYAQEYYERMMIATNNRLSGNYEFDSYKETEEGYYSLKELQIINISRRYNVSFVLSKNKNLTFPIIYDNEDFIIYDVRNIV